MPGFFDRLSDAVRAIPYTSSLIHRRVERSNVFIEMVSTGVCYMSPAIIIPSKFSQTIISIYAIMRKDTHLSEKILNTLQGVLALAQLGLAATLLYQDDSCDDTNPICKSAFLAQLLYTGSLAMVWTASEMAEPPFVCDECNINRSRVVSL